MKYRTKDFPFGKNSFSCIPPSVPKRKKADKNARFQHHFFWLLKSRFFICLLFVYIKRTDNRDYLTSYRLCICASGSLITDIFCLCTLIRVSCLHFGQNNGKFNSVVSCRSFIRVLFWQTGHNSHLSFQIYPPPFYFVLS